MEVVRIELATNDLFCRLRWQDAIDLAKQGLELAPDHGPLLGEMLFAYGNLGREREADSIYALVEPLKHWLTTTERLRVEWWHGRNHGDPDEERRAVELLFHIQPGIRESFF